MFNVKRHENNRVIEIRPFHEFKKDNKKTKNNHHVDKMTIQLEIEEAKRKLDLIEQQRQTRLTELSQEIEEEKAQWEQIKQDEMIRIKEEAFDIGFREGKEESLKQYENLLHKANELVEHATDQYYEQIEQHESAIIYLAVHIAEKILDEKLTEKPSLFVSIVQAVLKDLKDNCTYSIFLHPENYNSVIKQKNELYESVDEAATISLYIDEELEENSCLIEHSSGRIDASVDTQLREIKDILTQLTEQNE